MRFCLVIMCAFLMSSCVWFKTKPSCEIMDKYTATAAIGLSSFLGCKNVDAMAVDLAKATENLNLCTNDSMAGPLAEVFCAPIAAFISSTAVKSLPTRWECSGGAGAKAVYQGVYSACKLLPY